MNESVAATETATPSLWSSISCKQTGLKNSYQEIYKTAVVQMSHKRLLVATTRYTVNTRMRKPKTSEGAKHKLPQGFGHNSQPSGRAGSSAPLTFPQLSTAYKTVKKIPCTRGAGSPQQRKRGHWKAKGNTTKTRTRETKWQSSQGEEINTQPWLTFSFESTQLSFPMTAIPYLHSTGRHCSRPMLSPTVHVTHSYTLLS